MMFFIPLFYVETVLADVQIKNGFFIVGSSPKTTILEVSESDVIFCSGFCSITIDEASLSINYRGFNSIKNIVQITNSEKKWNSFQSTMKSRAAALENSTLKTSSQENKADSSEEATEDLQLEDSVPRNLTYTFPYPSDKTVFIHQSGGKIFFLAKDTCENACTAFVRKLGSKFSRRINFEKGQKPFWSIQIPPDSEKSEYRWTFEDGSEKQDHSFFVWKNNKENFKDALSVGTSIEILQLNP